MKIEKINCDFKIIKMDKRETLDIVNAKNNEKIIIYDDELKNVLFEKKFNKNYRELLYLILELNDSEDTTESDTELVFIKIEELRNKILNMKFLNKKEKEKYIKMLMLLAEKLNIPKRNRGR